MEQFKAMQDSKKQQEQKMGGEQASFSPLYCVQATCPQASVALTPSLCPPLVQANMSTK